MVASSVSNNFLTVFITVVLAGQAVRARALEFEPFLMSLVAANAARAFPVHPGQACDLVDGKKRVDQVRRTLPADWLSLLNGLTPRVLMQYEALAVPDELVYLAAVDGGNPGVPVTSVLSRALERTKVEGTNLARAEARAAHEAELRNDFFVALELSLHDSSPLLLDKLRRAYPLGFSAEMHDGPKAFKELITRYEATHIDHPERGSSS